MVEDEDEEVAGEDWEGEGVVDDDGAPSVKILKGP